MPWPDVKGKRCLDVWTFDESLRFEMAGYRVTHLAATPAAAVHRRVPALVWPCGTRWFAQRRHLPHAIGNPAQPTRSALAEQLNDLTT
jgi:hypothetical protein